jgi:hypothetical protein
MLMMILGYGYFIEPQFKALSNGLEAPDTSQSATVEELQALMTSLPQEAIDFYLVYFVIYDLFFPLSYMIFFATLYALLLKRIVPARSKFRHVALVPIVHGLIDYIENIGFIYMMSSLPDFSPEIAVIPLTISSIKWSFWPVEYLITIVLFAAAVIIWIKGKLAAHRTN